MHQDIIAALAQTKKGLSNIASLDTFFAQDELPGNSLTVRVEGFGDLPSTLDSPVIDRLKALATHAQYGLREKTLLNKKVRDTLEIKTDRLSVDDPDRVLPALLKRMQIQLGLPKKAELSAHLHNLLIYGPGQFFDKHRDSEKLPGMVASLIIVLPCAHIGGNLHIEQGKREFVFSSENLDSNACQCITFYADCQHHITPVRQGHRVALTYNVVMNAGSIQDEPQHRNPMLEKALIKYFDNNDNHKASDFARGFKKLAYVLEHSYSEHSLQWNLLKGIDHQNASALCHAAQQVGLVPHLALLEWHEMWTAYEKDEPEELIEADMTLSHWVDRNNQPLPYKAYLLDEKEVCSTVDIQNLEPDQSEYQGQMGNYGCTQDYWYRRAAIVLWSETDRVVADFEINFDAALANLIQSTQTPGQEQEVAQMIQALVPHLQHRTDSCLDALLTLAIDVKNPNTARLILTYGSIHYVTVTSVDSLVQLQELYGIDWCLSLLESWKENKNRWLYRDGDKLPGLPIHDFIKAQGDKRLGAFFLQYDSELFLKKNEELRSSPPRSTQSSLKSRLQRFAQLLQDCSLLNDVSTAHTLIKSVLEAPTAYPWEALGELVQDTSIIHMDAVQDLKNKVMSFIAEELARGLQTPDDWTVYKRLPSHCEDCAVANQFLSDAASTQKIWPLVANRRDHVQRLLKEYLIPVDSEVKRQGSPHKLILTKSPRLHTLAQERFHELKNLAQRLEAAVFCANR